jgi:hypothetical protein
MSFHNRQSSHRHSRNPRPYREFKVMTIDDLIRRFASISLPDDSSRLEPREPRNIISTMLALKRSVAIEQLKAQPIMQDMLNKHNLVTEDIILIRAIPLQGLTSLCLLKKTSIIEQ